MFQRDIVNLVLGVTSCGKSTYIASLVARGKWSGLPVVMACELEKGDPRGVLNGGCVVHYNLLRPLAGGQCPQRGDLLRDKVLGMLLGLRRRVRAVLLVAGKAELEDRIRVRSHVEPVFRGTRDGYPRGIFLDTLRGMNLEHYYARWFSLLRENGIFFEVLRPGQQAAGPDPSSMHPARIGAWPAQAGKPLRFPGHLPPTARSH